MIDEAKHTSMLCRFIDNRLAISHWRFGAGGVFWFWCGWHFNAGRGQLERSGNCVSSSRCRHRGPLRHIHCQWFNVGFLFMTFCRFNRHRSLLSSIWAIMAHIDLNTHLSPRIHQILLMVFGWTKHGSLGHAVRRLFAVFVLILVVDFFVLLLRGRMIAHWLLCLLKIVGIGSFLRAHLLGTFGRFLRHLHNHVHKVQMEGVSTSWCNEQSTRGGNEGESAQLKIKQPIFLESGAGQKSVLRPYSATWETPQKRFLH